MPFTPSHVAAILPFAGSRLAPAALVIGSLVPDVPRYLPIGLSRDFTHSLLGALTVDIAIGLAAFVLWAALLRAPVIDYAPRWVRRRMNRAARWRTGERTIGGLLLSVAMLCIALVLGILTHISWDFLTHDGWLTSAFPVLGAGFDERPLILWAHRGSSVIGLVVTAAWLWRWVSTSTPAADAAGTRLLPWERVASWGAIAAVLIASTLTAWTTGVSAGAPAFAASLVFSSVSASLGVALAAAALAVLVWHLRFTRGPAVQREQTSSDEPLV